MLPTSPHTRNTFITSSPRWLITLTAILPDLGFGKAREASLQRLAQASSSISARLLLWRTPVYAWKQC